MQLFGHEVQLTTLVYKHRVNYNSWLVSVVPNIQIPQWKETLFVLQRNNWSAQIRMGDTHSAVYCNTTTSTCWMVNVCCDVCTLEGNYHVSTAGK